MNITIVGLGLIGGSLAKGLRNARFAVRLLGVDSDSRHAAEALALGLVDEVLPFEEAVGLADIIILAIPVDGIKTMLPAVLDIMPAATTVTDMGSAKQVITSAVAAHPRRRNYVAAHPMAGTEDSGPAAAVERLFTGKMAIICDQDDSGPQHLALVEKMFLALSMNIVYMSADDHDHSTAFISHLPHATAFALANAVQDKADRSIIFDLAGGGFRSTVRLAKSSPSMWGPVFSQNRKYVLEALNVYMKHLAELTESIRNKNDEGQMYALMDNANKVRDILKGENSALIKDESTVVKYYRK